MPVPVLTVAQMRAWEEQSWDKGRSQNDVIERVGQLVAQRALELTRPDDRILILAGKGHNGDDARCVQPHLADRKVALLRAKNPTDALEEIEPFLAKPPDLIIDGVFGIGLSRALDQPWIQFFERINRAGVRVLAVDVPSGLNADTGEVAGAAIRAEVTLTLGAPKKGLLAAGGQSYVGRLEVVPDIGLVPCPVAEAEQQWLLPTDFEGFPPLRMVDGHKGSFGHAAIVAGSRGYHGAAVLATRGALRARPGLVTLFCPEDVYVPIASQLQAAMVHPWEPEESFPESCTAIVLGPGMAGRTLPESCREFTRIAWQESAVPVVVDASALAWVPPGAMPERAVRVMTPHPGEAARLLGVSSREVQANRLGAVRELSRRYGGCQVVLKGHQTLIGGAEGPVFINSSGNPELAQGGSGDVLAGYLGGLLAQPALRSDWPRVVHYAVWQHGATADQLSLERLNWTVEELLRSLGNFPIA